MNIIACLGNPGRKYAKNRHNIGFIAGEYIADQFNISIRKSNFNAKAGTGTINNSENLLLFPATYMNNSGQSIKKAMDFYKIKPTNLIVIHDEIELPFGVVKTKWGGGHKGQNGIRSIIENIGTPDFHRIRYGVGRPTNEHISVADHVLSKFFKRRIENYK